MWCVYACTVYAWVWLRKRKGLKQGSQLGVKDELVSECWNCDAAAMVSAAGAGWMGRHPCQGEARMAVTSSVTSVTSVKIPMSQHPIPPEGAGE